MHSRYERTVAVKCSSSTILYLFSDSFGELLLLGVLPLALVELELLLLELQPVQQVLLLFPVRCARILTGNISDRDQITGVEKHSSSNTRRAIGSAHETPSER